MKKIFAVLLTLLCIAAGILRWSTLDTALDPVSGFPLDDRLLPQYGLIFLPLLLIALAVLLVVPGNVSHRPLGFAALPGFCGMLFSGILCLCLYILQYGTLPQLICSLLLLAGSLWFAGYAIRRDNATLLTGMAALLAWLIITVLAFRVRTASIWHVTTILEMLGCLSALLFFALLLRSVYSPGVPGISPFLCLTGFICFYLGSCLMLPQELWQWMNGQQTQLLFGKSIAAAGLGLSGLITALQCLIGAGEECTDTADAGKRPIDPSADAAFAEAAERLKQEQYPFDGNAPADRWQNAAATLYGSSPTQESVPQGLPAQPARESAAQNIPAQPTAAPAAKPFDTAKDAPSAPTAAGRPAGPTAPAAPTQTAPDKPDTGKRQSPTADSILADLGIELPAENKDDSENGDSGWIFHRG